MAKTKPSLSKEDKALIKKLSQKSSKSDVIRMEILYPDHLTTEHKKVLKTIQIERAIYMTAADKIGLDAWGLTPILNLGHATLSARNRVHDKITGTRAYSLLDLAVIQLLELMVRNGVDIQKITYNPELQTSLPSGSLSKTELVTAVREGKKLRGNDQKGLEQFKLQHRHYSRKMQSTKLDTWTLAYIVSLGSQTKSTYNRVHDKLKGTRPYSVLDLVIARLLEVAHQKGIAIGDITYNKDGARTAPNRLVISEDAISA